ncbi:MAG TPA: TraB/GumN family protein [Chthoniobacterales bacterium]|jgi:hypothetical protein|nr:TraB/GumN family protein [Chthoniobacterales bacterium]
MFSRRSLLLAVGFYFSVVVAHAGPACVWKVTGPRGGTLYLGGSVHALRSTDYPLPATYNRAFEACDRLVFEADSKALLEAEKDFVKAGRYGKGDSLRNHVDPRTYAYLRRFFDLVHFPEEQFSRLKPWALALLLQAPQLHGLSPDLGVEGYLERRAQANHKPVSGLESAREGIEVFSGLTDRQSEAMLLLTFIPQENGGNAMNKVMTAWRHGDVETIARESRQEMADFPALGERVIDARNRNWIPKIERDLQSGRIYFVVVGAGHFGGPNGLLALLRARGCRIEQL